MKWGVSVGVLVVVAAALVAVQAGPTVTKVCIANESWKEDCNDCICTEAGQPVCTKRVCPSSPGPSPTPRPKGECTPGAVWRQSCNSCRCTATGVGICTQMACLDEEAGRPTVGLPLPLPMPDHTRLGGHVCQEGHTWKQDCNTCRCVGGRAACTMMACLSLGASGAGTGLENPSLMPSSTAGRQRRRAGVQAATISQRSDDCTPGESWREEDCRTCRCLASGMPACTMAYRCIAKREVRTPSAPARLTEAAQDTQPASQGHHGSGPAECVSGTHWTQDCNSCSCINGRAACTLALCVGAGRQ